MTLSQNALLTAFRQGLTKFGLINFEKTKAFAAQCIEKFGVKAAGPHAEARFTLRRKFTKDRGPRNPAAAESADYFTAHLGSRCRGIDVYL